MDVSRGLGLALGTAALLVTAGCQDKGDRSQQGSAPGATASQQAERSQEQAADASKRAAERHDEAADAQKDLRESQQKLAEDRQKAEQKTGEARQSEQQAQQRSRDAQQQTAQAEQQSGAAAAGTGSAAGASAQAGGEQKTATGQVVSASSQELVLRDQAGGQELKLKVGSDTPVMVDGKRASISDVKEGSQVRASYSEQGGQPQAIRIEVQGGAQQQGATGGTR